MTNARGNESHYDCDLSRVRTARHFVRDTLLRWGLPTLMDEAGLMVSELVANAVRHARSDFAVKVDVTDKVTVTVVDHGGPINETPADPSQTYPGHGLTIVRTIADSWGVTPVENGKAVWFTMLLPETDTADAGLFDLADRRTSETLPAEAAEAVEARLRSAV